MNLRNSILRRTVRAEIYKRTYWLLVFCHAGAAMSIFSFMAGNPLAMTSPGFGFAMFGLIVGLATPLIAPEVMIQIMLYRGRRLAREVENDGGS